MDSGEGSSNANYFYGDQLQEDSFVSPVKTDNESSVDIYDGLDTDYQGDVSGKSKHAKDCFDLYEEILTEEGTAKEISLKEFQEKSVEREREVEELVQKLHEVETKNSTLSNENIQLKKNISALIKTARQEIIRKDEEINRLNRSQSMNRIGNPGLRRYHNQYTHSPASFNVPVTSQNDNTYSRHNRPCPSRSANVEQCPLTPHLNEEGKCPQDGPLLCGNKTLEPKSQCNLPRSAKSLSSPHSLVGRERSGKSSSHANIAPLHKPNVIKDKAELFPCKERKGIEKLNGDDLVGTVERLHISTAELSGPGNKELNFPEKIDKLGQSSQSTKPHSQIKSIARHSPEKRSDKIRHRLGQGSATVSSKNSTDLKDSKSHVEKEEKHKEKETKRSDPREQSTDRKKELRSNREDAKDKQRDERLRSRSFQKEKEPERRHSEKRRDSSKLTSSTSPCKSSRWSTCAAVEHTSRERKNQKIESKSLGKERSTEDRRDRRSKQSKKVQDEETVKDGVRQSGKNDNKGLKKDESKKEKGKSDHKENKRDYIINRHSLRNGRNCIDKEHQSKKEKTRLSEGNERMTRRHCTEDSVRDHGTGNLQSPTGEQSSARNTDPKLHFMETLQLTVSPVKRPSAAPCEVEVPCTQMHGEAETVGHTGRMAYASEKSDFSEETSSNEASKADGKSADCESTEMRMEESGVSVPPVNREPAELEMVPSALLKGDEMEEGVQVILVEDPDPVKLTQIVVETVGTVEVISEAVGEVVENSTPSEEIDVNEHSESVGNPSEVDKSVSELNKASQQLMEVDYTVDGQCGSSEGSAEIDHTVSSEKVLSLTGAGNPCDSGQPVDVATVVIEQLLANSEPDFTDRELQRTTGSVVDSSAVTSPVKKSCAPDDMEDNSSQSIDFTYIGCLGAPISPLTSPLRPVRSSALEKSDTFAERDVDHKGKDSKVKVQDGCSLSSCTLELNKENQEPLCKAGVKALGISEEIEEGEIVSDVDECSSQVQKPACNVQVVEESNNEEKGNPGQSPSEKETRPANPDESAVKYSSKLLPKIKSLKKQAESKSVPSNQNSEGLKISSLSSVERNQIKSSVTDLMEALMVARKIIRKKYMKLHKLFEFSRFKRIIEISIAEFTSIVKRTKFPKSRQRQKSSICALIETILSQVKCNGIVTGIFSQQAPNMKEKLWIFVEKQFDYVFEKARETFISCENISLELALEEERKKLLIKSKKRNTTVKHKADKLPKVKRSSEPSLANNVSGKRNSEKKEPVTDGSKQKGTTSNKHSTKCIELSAAGISKENSKPSTKVKHLLSGNQMNLNASSDSLINSNSTKDSHEKTELGILTEHQASTLTFNLVSDAQMGEIFKCLLQGSDLLEQGISTLESNSWPVPEKMHPDVGTHLSGITSTSEKAPVVSQGDGISWPPVTPNKHTVGLRPPLNIDILDESCMLEIPEKVVQNKDAQVIRPPEDSNIQKVIEATSSVLQMRSSISSILMEDLAVSLTVPSPLKSDGEISFLTSQNGLSLSGEVSEAVLSGHYSENAVLDEEDASEQDIHLALDSDNSSSRSSSSSMWNKSGSAFQYQYHPPMQAVVMEKSNDHFIVKIRCRASNTDSPLQSSASAVPVKENETSESGSSGGPVMETIDKQTILSCNNVEEVPEEQDHVMSEPLPNHSLFVDHPIGESRSELGMEIDMQLSHSEKDHPLLTKNCTDHEPLLETPSGNTKGVALLTATILEPAPKSGNRKRKCKTKVDSTEKRARKETEPLKTSKKNSTKATRKSTSSAKKALKKTAVTPEKKMTNTSRSTVSSPTSLPAKNVIKKNGEVVITWTREDDRSILLDCQQKGANEETFSYISRKLHRSPRQVSERFHCLMKLFKRTETKNN